jgi:hypothetical protein
MRYLFFLCKLCCLVGRTLVACVEGKILIIFLEYLGNISLFAKKCGVTFCDFGQCFSFRISVVKLLFKNYKNRMAAFFLS